MSDQANLLTENPRIAVFICMDDRNSKKHFTVKNMLSKCSLQPVCCLKPRLCHLRNTTSTFLKNNLNLK